MLTNKILEAQEEFKQEYSNADEQHAYWSGRQKVYEEIKSKEENVKKLIDKHEDHLREKVRKAEEYLSHFLNFRSLLNEVNKESAK